MSIKYKFNNKIYKYKGGQKDSYGYLIYDIFKYYLEQNSNKTYEELQAIFNPLHKEFSGKNSNKKVVFDKKDFLNWFNSPNNNDGDKHKRYFGYGKYAPPTNYNGIELYFTTQWGNKNGDYGNINTFIDFTINELNYSIEIIEDLTIFDKLVSVLRDKEKEIFSRKQIISMVLDKYPSTNETSIIPSDYCYNKKNKGSSKDELFLYLENAEYKYVGTNKNTNVKSLIDLFINILEINNNDKLTDFGLKLESISSQLNSSNTFFYVYTNDAKQIIAKPIGGQARSQSIKTGLEKCLNNSTLKCNELTNPDNIYGKAIIKYIIENFTSPSTFTQEDSTSITTKSTPINKILYGPPGTGKTYKLQELQKQYDNRYTTVTFHQSYGYEDFVEGLKAEINKSGDVYYDIKKGIFREICEKAEKDTENQYAIFIDEINRGNISKIFGELITLIEVSKRGMEIVLPYSTKPFSVPKNLSIIGTMNTADRSIAVLDTALRRRFEFEEMMPEPYHEDISQDIGGINVQELLAKINKRIEFFYDRDHMIGHAYFIGCQDFTGLQNIFKNKIIPLLQEYFYDDWEKINLILNNNGFIQSKNYKQNELFPNCKDFDEFEDDKNIYSLNNRALQEKERYTQIYDKIENQEQGE